MKIPETERAGDYVDLYIIDFGDSCAMGYTADEVAVLLESERFAEAKVYRIYGARPDGSMEIVGVAREKFGLESGMFFHCRTEETGRRDYEYLCGWSEENRPPCRAKLHLAKLEDGTLLIGLIYPAEYEHQVGKWLSGSEFRGEGAVDAGISQVSRYYESKAERRAEKQLTANDVMRCRGRDELLACVGIELQR